MYLIEGERKEEGYDPYPTPSFPPYYLFPRAALHYPNAPAERLEQAINSRTYCKTDLQSSSAVTISEVPTSYFFFYCIAFY